MTTAEPAMIPATPMQEALWWVHQRARNQSVYHLTWRLAVDRALDEPALRTAWQAVVDRHEALRTAVRRSGDILALEVAPRLAVGVHRIEVPDPGPVEPTSLLRLLAEEVHGQPLEPDTAPLARLTLVRVAGRHEVLLTVHHVVLDGWAVQLLIGELSEAYEAAQAGRPVSFPTTPVPFSTYALEQAAARAEGHWDKSVSYWCDTLTGAAASVLVPDLPGTAASGAPGTILRYAFSAEAATGMAVLAKATFATPFAIILAAAQIVLARSGAGPDVTIGVVTANRTTARDQALVGYTANLCLVRGTVEADDTVTAVVSGARDAMWQMLLHQAVPYPVVFAALPESTRTALGDPAPVLLSYLGHIGSDLRLGAVPAALLPSPNRAARADLAMSAFETDGGFQVEIEYHTGRYRESTVLGLLHDLDAVLADGGAEPGRTVGSFEVTSRARAGRETPVARPVSDGGARAAGALLESPDGRRVVAAWSRLTGGPPDGPDTDFFAVGGNSLRALQLATLLEADGHPAVDVVRWLREPTVRRLVEQLGGETAPVETPSTLVTVRGGAGTHLHLVHGAGGSLHDYQELVALLPTDWRVTVSRDSAELTTVPTMARRYGADLAAAGLAPDLLGGWSLGGQIAYQMAAEQGGRRPALVLLDSAPPTGYALPDDGVRQRFDTFAENVRRSLGLAPGKSSAHTGGGPDPDGFDERLAVAALAAGLAAAGEPVSADALARRWHDYQRHIRAGVTYVHPGPVDTPALVIGAELLDAQLGLWTERLGAVRTRQISVDHFAVLRPPAVAEVAAAVIEFARVEATRG
ncbi:condensation domain-containing protein [Micromonospora deserti]|uniref:Condensation protein n=1 Tax=Micromonospora deserti TaxID=2070366 RepID=A0A2W2DS64_9ACTN|nr:condensation domain-containing protein [Micromonospora deserti]PZG02548.1 condensation protein [Micromonospora deserti]